MTFSGNSEISHGSNGFGRTLWSSEGAWHASERRRQNVVGCDFRRCPDPWILVDVYPLVPFLGSISSNSQQLEASLTVIGGICEAFPWPRCLAMLSRHRLDMHLHTAHLPLRICCNPSQHLITRCPQGYRDLPWNMVRCGRVLPVD